MDRRTSLREKIGTAERLLDRESWPNREREHQPELPLAGGTMDILRKTSRRQFISTTAAATAAIAIPGFARQTPGAAAAPVLDRDWADAGIIATRNSPYAKLKSVPVQAVTIETGFWSKRRTTNVTSSIPSMHQELLDHGRMDNFLRLAGQSQAPQRGPVYSDSDIYKWIESVGFTLQSQPLPELRSQTDAMIREIVAVQEPSGYLNTYYVGDHKSERMLWKTQTTGHELYNIGHLLQGAIAYYRATGDPTLLQAGMRFVDGFLLPGFGPGANQAPIVAGHPEIEMSLIELYRTTGNKRYLDLAGYILQGDSRNPLTERQIVYMFCGIPFTSRTKLEGHAVRAMYACCGATDYYLETGDQAYWKTLNVLWNDLTAHQLYVNGGVGARAAGEAFGDAYELPNAQAYGESCAAIGNMMWNWRMLAASGESKHADVIERALYNGINSGMSLDGTKYCYRNPLAFNPESGEQIRNPWYDTTCCPPNLERTFASLPGYFYSTSSDGIYVHLYDNSTLDWQLENGMPIKVVQKTNYPWDGDVKLTVSPAEAADFEMNVRIPGWAKSAKVAVNGKTVDGAKPGEYLAISRRWSPGDTITLAFPMSAEIVASNPRVEENLGRVAVQRGPIVYCMEGLDQNPSAADFSEVAIVVNPKSLKAFEMEHQPTLLDGVTVLKHGGAVSD